jgi:hypothetical protein
LRLSQRSSHSSPQPDSCVARRFDVCDVLGPGGDNEAVAEPTAREQLLARIDEHCRLLALELDHVREATEQLAPERARSCRNAITMASVMIDEIRLRAHSRPIDDAAG